MKHSLSPSLVTFLLVSMALTMVSCKATRQLVQERIVSHEVDPRTDDLRFYRKDEKDATLKSFRRLNEYLKRQDRKLLFAMNGGMHHGNLAPVGLYIENQETITPLDTTSAKGNFYLKPNGVFYLTVDNEAHICKTEDFVNDGQVKYATQSGPMLLINGEYHPKFDPKSDNLRVRNGVGILPNNKVLFAMSTARVSFYEFAKFFRDKGCENALYLDGEISRMYLPSKGMELLHGGFGVIIAVSEKK